MLRLQLGHTHSLFFHWLYTCPKMSTPGWSTISTNDSGKQELWVKGGFFQKAAYTKIVPSYTNGGEKQEKVLALGTAHTHWLN